MAPRFQTLLLAALAALALGGCMAAELADADRGALTPDQRRVTFSTMGGDCLRAVDEPDGVCLPNPGNCAYVEIEYDPATGMGCEVCYGPAGEILSSHCGQTAEAECTRMENDIGGTCTVCSTPSGGIVFDSCHTDSQTGQDLRCEGYTDPQGQACEICYDEYGDVVSRQCFAPDYWCEEWDEDGQRCRRCYEGDLVVSESCGGETTWVDPNNCTIITSGDGSTCYTCTDAAGSVVDHNCSGPEPAWCDYYQTQDNASCEVCYDAHGAMVSQECWREQPVETCREYRSEDSICVICTDAEGTITHRDCRPICSDEGVPCSDDADCAQGAACVDGACRCEPAPPCELFYTMDGTLCEICGDLNGDGVVNEEDANCFPNPTDPVNCWTEQRTDQSSGETLVCTICQSEAGGLTEECRPGGSSVTPDVTCEVEQTADGQVCEVCRDLNGQVVHSSCDDLFCRDDEVPGFSGDSAFALCQICEQGDQLMSLACDMHNVCRADDNTTGSDPGVPGTGYGDACGNVWMSREPVQCGGTPWETWWREAHPQESFTPVQEGEVIRAYYLEGSYAPVTILAYRIENAFQVDSCTECSCPRGDIVYIYVSYQDAERLQSQGWRLGY